MAEWVRNTVIGHLFKGVTPSHHPMGGWNCRLGGGVAGAWRAWAQLRFLGPGEGLRTARMSRTGVESCVDV